MPINVRRHFGRTDADLARAQDWMDHHADTEGVLHVVEVFEGAPEPEEKGEIYVISDDQLEEFQKRYEASQVIDSNGHNPGELDGEES